MRATRVYLAGPMTGLPEWNFPAFDKAAAHGRSLGFDVVSPADLDRDAGLELDHDADINGDTLRAVVRRDLDAILSADAIALLPGWENPKGANAELGVAHWLNLRVLDATTWEPHMAAS